MTHKEAIEILSNVNAYHEWHRYEAMDYAINQLKQCEVFNEPVSMEICDQSDFRNIHIAKVYAKTFAGYVVYDAELFEWQLWEYARPIKKEPLSFTEYAEDKGITLQDFGNDVIEKYYSNYQKYLNQFKKK